MSTNCQQISLINWMWKITVYSSNLSSQKLQWETTSFRGSHKSQSDSPAPTKHSAPGEERGVCVLLPFIHTLSAHFTARPGLSWTVFSPWEWNYLCCQLLSTLPWPYSISRWVQSSTEIEKPQRTVTKHLSAQICNQLKGRHPIQDGHTDFPWLKNLPGKELHWENHPVAYFWAGWIIF